MTPGAVRQRKYRERQRLGVVDSKVDIPLELAERLIEAGLITDMNVDDPERLGAACGKICGTGNYG